MSCQHLRDISSVFNYHNHNHNHNNNNNNNKTEIGTSNLGHFWISHMWLDKLEIVAGWKVKACFQTANLLFEKPAAWQNPTHQWIQCDFCLPNCILKKGASSFFLSIQYANMLMIPPSHECGETSQYQNHLMVTSTMRQWWDNETTSQNPAHVFGPSPHKNEIFFPWFPRFRDPGSPEDNCLMLVEVDSRESNSDSLLFVVEMMSQIHVFRNSAVLRKWATPSNSMYHLQCQLCIWESQLGDEALHVGCAGFIGLQTPYNRSTCQLHMLTMCAYDSTMPPGNSTSILKMTRWKRYFLLLFQIYIYIYQVGGFFSSTQVNKTEANWIISSMAIRNIRNDQLKSTRWPVAIFPRFPSFLRSFHDILRQVHDPVFNGGGSRVRWSCCEPSFYGEIQESDGKFKHQT